MSLERAALILHALEHSVVTSERALSDARRTCEPGSVEWRDAVNKFHTTRTDATIKALREILHAEVFG